jgi:hypothetical protein
VPEEGWRQFELIAEHCKRTKKDKLLIDITKAKLEISLVERFQAAKSAQIFASHEIKVALIAISEQMDSQKFFTLAARNRGVNVDAFTDLHAAEEWLLK